MVEDVEVELLITVVKVDEVVGSDGELEELGGGLGGGTELGREAVYE